MDDPSRVSKRWHSAPQELIDLVFTEAVLTPLQVHASRGSPHQSSRALHAANPDHWKCVINILAVSKQTRAAGLLILSLHGALEHVPLAKVDLKIRFTLPIPSHTLLRRFRWIYTRYTLQLSRDLSQAKLFVNVPGPPRVNHAARIEIKSTIDPRQYTTITQKMLIQHPESKAVNLRAEEEDLNLMEFVFRLCRGPAWYWAFQPSAGPHLGHTIGTAADARRMIVWEGV
jgi:hypothetical protein